MKGRKDLVKKREKMEIGAQREEKRKKRGNRKQYKMILVIFYDLVVSHVEYKTIPCV